MLDIRELNRIRMEDAKSDVERVILDVLIEIKFWIKEHDPNYKGAGESLIDD